MALSDAKAKQLLKDAAEKIRDMSDKTSDSEEVEFLLNLAAVVELQDPQPLRT